MAKIRPPPLWRHHSKTSADATLWPLTPPQPAMPDNPPLGQFLQQDFQASDCLQLIYPIIGFSILLCIVAAAFTVAPTLAVTFLASSYRFCASTTDHMQLAEIETLFLPLERSCSRRNCLVTCPIHRRDYKIRNNLTLVHTLLAPS